MQITTVNHGLVSIIPFQPVAPMGEALEHLTDIMQATDGSESRVPLRSKPRLVYTYDFPAKLFDTPALFNMIYSALRKKFAVPVWQQASALQGGASFGATELTLTTGRDVDSFDYVPDGLALIYSRNSAGTYVWEVVTVDSVDVAENSVILADPVAGIFSGIVYIMPLRIGYVVDKVTRKTNGYASGYSVSFEIIDNPPLVETVPAQYKGLDIYTEVGLMPQGGFLQRDFVAEIDKVDLQIGPIFKRTQWKYTQYSYTYRQVFENPQEVSAWKSRFQRHHGKARQFWQPSFDINVRLKSIGSGGTTADIYADDYGIYGQQHKVLAFRMMDGSTDIREITNAVAIDGTTTRITFASPIAFQKSDEYVVSYLSVHRLDGDTLEINWIGGGKAEMAIRMLELAPYYESDET